MKVNNIRHPDNPNNFGTHKRTRKYNKDKDGKSYSERRLRFLIENGTNISDTNIAKILDWYVVEPVEQHGQYPNHGEIIRGARRTLRDALYMIQNGRSFGSRDGGNRNQKFKLQTELWKEYMEKYPYKIHPYWHSSLVRDSENRKENSENVPAITKPVLVLRGDVNE